MLLMVFNGSTSPFVCVQWLNDYQSSLSNQNFMFATFKNYACIFNLSFICRHTDTVDNMKIL